MMNSKWHKACSWLASLLWAVAGVSLLLAWWAVYRRGLRHVHGDVGERDVRILENFYSPTAI